MEQFITAIKYRNEPLFYFGAVCFFFSIVFILLSIFNKITVSGANAWFKPFKFALSIGSYSLTMAWYVYYIPNFNVGLFNYTVIILLGFELLYIALQAGRGQQSHFNQSSPLYAALYSAMAIAATWITLYTAYIGILFFQIEFANLPDYYIWGIRIGIIVFVVFSLEGFVMGSRLSHTIGGTDGGNGIPVLNWSTKYGDPRIAHFIGMHALQIIPLLSFYVLKSVKLTFIVGILYFALALFTLIQALNRKPLIKL